MVTSQCGNNRRRLKREDQIDERVECQRRRVADGL